MAPWSTAAFERFSIVYDFGDYWRHDVRSIEDLRDGSPDVDYPAFVDGARRRAARRMSAAACGFMEFLEAMSDPNHEEHDAHGRMVRQSLRS